MPKHQTSLQSFFNAAATNNKKAGHAAAVAASGKKSTTNIATTKNTLPVADAVYKKRAVLKDEDDDDTTKTSSSRTPGTAAQASKRRRRRCVIDDEDDDDDGKPDEDAKDDISMKDSKDDVGEEEAKEEEALLLAEVDGSVKNDKKENADNQKKEATTTITATAAKDTEPKNEKEDKDKNEEKACDKPLPTVDSSKKKQTTKSVAVNSFFQPKSKSALDNNNNKATTKKAEETKDQKDCHVQDEFTGKTCLPPPSFIFKASAKGNGSSTISVASDQEVLEAIDCQVWPESTTRLPYLVLCQAFAKIEEITGRLQIQEILTTVIRQVLLRSYCCSRSRPHGDEEEADDTDDLRALLYLASNEVAPAYQCVELGIGDSLLIKAIGEATGTVPNIIKAKYESIGDLGTVAMSFKSKQKTLGGFFGNAAPPAKLSAQTVLDVFREIASTKGSQAQKWKVDKIKKLLVKASHGMETKYIIRGLQGKLRIGLAQSTVLIALAHALSLTQVVPSTTTFKKNDDDDDDNDNDDVEDKLLPQEAKQYLDASLSVEKRLEGGVAIIKKAYSEVPSYDALLDAALSVPLERLHEKCTLQPGIPVAPMLAKPTKSIQEVLKRLNGLLFTCEFKYDGERAQVHMLPDGTAKVFSRNLLDTSEKFPEVPRFVREACRDNSKLQSFIMDAEVVAYNQKTGQLVPFQVLSTRKKTQESNETAKVQIIVQAFDLMYLNGESCLSKTLNERRKLLHEHFQAVDGKFQFAQYLDHQENGDTTVLEEFLDQAVKGQCEGLMVKTLDVNAVYEPSRRSLNWLKLKKDYLEGLGDSVDLVPLGAYHGKGKRTGVYGAYLLACYDPDSEEFQSVCKIGTGFSDEDLANLAKQLNEHVIPQKSSQYNVSDQLHCDVWFDAVQVWEVKAADLSKSSAHMGAVGKTGDRGIGLRFPRFERVREDKKPVEATTSDQILEMYYNQDTIAGSGGGGDDDDDDGI